MFTSRIIIQKVLHWKDLKSTWKELLTKTAAVLEMLISCSIKRFGWNEAIEWQLSIDLKSRWPEITQNGMTMCNLTDDSLDQRESFENLFSIVICDFTFRLNRKRFHSKLWLQLSQCCVISCKSCLTTLMARRREIKNWTFHHF